MTFEQIIATVREWQSTMTPQQAREATERLVGGLAALDVLALPATVDVDKVLALASGGGRSVTDLGQLLRWPAPPPRKAEAAHESRAGAAPPPVIEPSR